MDKKLKSEQLEEGEIIDDDDFEDISDNSIIEPALGKLVSSYENLRALPLSSDSDIEKAKEIRYKRKTLHHKSKVKLRKRRKRVRLSSDSSDSDKSPPDDLKGKLKEAIRIADVEEGHKNPLEKRLKAMGGLAPSETVIETPEPILESQPRDKVDESSDKIDDAELENLRMEALKTAVLNKCQRRKRKKALLEAQETAIPLQTLENKENNTPKDGQSDQQKDEKIVNNGDVDLEEDEDILRASLLAGLAKKIAKIQTPNESLVVKKVAPKLPIKAVPILPKRPLNKFKSNTLSKQVFNKQVVINKLIQKATRAKPQVKPLIINVNGDSDSEEETKSEPPSATPQVAQKSSESKTAPAMTNLIEISSNVEKFLKEQRAKFETDHKLKTETIKVKDKTILEKSAVKLLPKSQQIEYQQLLKRLKIAERKKKAKKLALEQQKVQAAKEPPKTNVVALEIVQNGAQVVIENVTVESAPEVIIKLPTPTKSSNEDASRSDSSQVRSSKGSDTSERRKVRITNELTTLQRTLKEIRTQRNGRFQIQSKYQVLTPIIRKITATRNESKKQEHRIKSLLQELNEARSNLSNSHERFSTLVRELITKKDKIDKSHQDLKTGNRKINGKIIRDTKSRKSGNRADEIKKDAKLPVTSTPIKGPFNESDEATISTFLASSNNECEDMDVCNSDETDICQIDIVDPNDIDQIFKRKPLIKSAIPEYVSPLNYNTYERYSNVDPLGIMCPYEVNGSCRDVDCTYKHYLKRHDRQ